MNNIDKQSIDLIGDAYKNFEKQFGVVKEDIESFILKRKMIEESLFPDKNEFIRLIKTSNDFAKKWGVEVEVRELELGERQKILIEKGYSGLLHSNTKNYKSGKKILEVIRQTCDDVNIPTKSISLTYNDKTIESYE
jgi:hypothetical protein